MSIRLRFTLLYTTILALTLAIFGFVLHGIQEQETLNSLKRDLNLSSGKIVEALHKNGSRLISDGFGKQHPSPPVSYENFSDDQAFQEYPEGEITRVLDGEGKLVASPFGRQTDTLPLSPQGLAALQTQKEWWETVELNGETLLIYNYPIVQDNETVYIVQTARSLSERERNLRSLSGTMLLAGLITVVVAFGIGWIISGIMLRPVKRITQTAKEIGEKRDFSRRVDYQGPQDEIGQLAATFNSMLGRIQEAFEKVEHALKMQKDFVADVSHELRTPLTTLRGNLDLLKRQPPAPPEEQEDILNDMVFESDRLIRLVNNLLLLAHADAGRSLAQEPVKLIPLIEETIRQAKNLEPARTIQMDLQPGLTVFGDRDAIKQVLLIGLDNAFKHAAGEIKVETRQTPSKVEIRIIDRGNGIAPEKLEHIFNRFYRGGDTSTLSGFGLGLPIARSLTERQGGAIRMESQLGQGSQLIIELHSKKEA